MLHGGRHDGRNDNHDERPAKRFCPPAMPLFSDGRLRAAEVSYAFGSFLHNDEA